MVVVDQSMALIMAVVKTFTQYSTLSMYLNVCWNLLANVRNRPDVPTCFIRLDFNHIMHSVASWPPLRSKQRRVKSFYLYAIGLLITCTSLEDAKYLFKQIFYVSHHEEDGMNDASEPTACEIAKRYLKERIATHNNDINMEEEGDCSNINEPDIQDGNELFEDHYQITSPCTVFDEVKKIYDICAQEKKDRRNVGDHDNMQWDPLIAAKLLEFSKLLPLWSAVMTPIFGYGSLTASSAPAESRFNDLKNRVFQHMSLPLRVDKFIETHVTSILGELNLMKANSQQKENIEEHALQRSDDLMASLTSLESEYNVKNIHSIEHGKNSMNIDDSAPVTPLCRIDGEKENPSEKKSKGDVKNVYRNEHDENSINIDDPTAVENWRGLGDKEKVSQKKRKSKYTDPDPSIKFVKENMSSCTVIGILKNGIHEDIRVQTFDGKKYSMIFTCAFDAIFHAFCVAIVDSDEFRHFIEQNEINPFFEIILSAITGSISSETYVKRARILLTIFKKEVKLISGIYTVNCITTVHNIINNVLRGFPTLVHEIECLSCTHITERRVPILTAHFPTPTSDVKNLKNFVESEIERTTRRCGTCGSTEVVRRDTWMPYLLLQCCYRELDIKVCILLNYTIEKFKKHIGFYQGAIKDLENWRLIETDR